MEYKELLIEKNMTVQDAMKKLETMRPKILFVVEGNVLAGSLTDGDIRRYLLAGGSISDTAFMACNKQPKKVAVSLDEAKSMISKDYIAIPVIDENRNVIDIYWGEDKKNAHGALNIPVVINAGGKGTRLEPFTKVLPKPLIPVGDLPIIEHIIHRYQEYGCNNFYTIVNYKKELIKTYFNEINKDYSISWVDENTPLGTGGGISLLKGIVKEPFFFISCDNLITSDYSKIYEAHRKSSNAITIICARKNVAIPYGVVETNDQMEYLGMKEKPSLSFLTNTASYIIEPEIIEDVKENERIDFPDIIKMEKSVDTSICI